MTSDWLDISTAPNGRPEAGYDAPLIRLRLEDGMERHGRWGGEFWVGEDGARITPDATHWGLSRQP